MKEHSGFGRNGYATCTGIPYAMLSLTSPLGQSRHFGRWPTTSGLPLETDIVRAGSRLSKVP